MSLALIPTIFPLAIVRALFAPSEQDTSEPGNDEKKLAGWELAETWGKNN